jgi:hypothetical protein
MIYGYSEASDDAPVHEDGVALGCDCPTCPQCGHESAHGSYKEVDRDTYDAAAKLQLGEQLIVCCPECEHTYAAHVVAAFTCELVEI